MFDKGCIELIKMRTLKTLSQVYALAAMIRVRIRTSL
jgi:hypothetical protein